MEPVTAAYCDTNKDRFKAVAGPRQNAVLVHFCIKKEMPCSVTALQLSFILTKSERSGTC
jgi:hypothetical protein